MKFNKIAFASLICLAGSASAAGSASTPTPKPPAPIDVVCNKTDALKFVTTCQPKVTFVIAGSSALGDSVSTILTNTVAGTAGNGYFDTTTTPVVTIVDTGTPNGVSVANPTNYNGTKAGNGVSAWFGMSRAILTGGVSVPMLVVYNKYMGSAAGVSSLLAADIKLVPEADLVTVGPIVSTVTKKLIANPSCDWIPSGGLTVLGATTTSIATASNKVQCSSHAFTRADIALSDVDIPELAAVYPTAKDNLKKLTNYTRVPLAMQGFGIAVNNNFYNALQAAQFTSSACPAGTSYTEACQPSISRAQYASLVTKEGNIKSAGGFIPSDSSKLVLARRDELSGTQATSNMYFAGTICSKSGALTPIGAKDTTASLIVNENVQTDEVVDNLSDNTDGKYVIGMIALAKTSTLYKFVKLDGVSPNFPKGGGTAYTSASDLRKNLVDGSWGLQMTAYAAYNTAQATIYDADKSPKATLINSFVTDMSKSSLTDLKALSYFDGAGTTKQTKVSRLNGNNCSPLISRTN
jgi:hypothetical protein